MEESTPTETSFTGAIVMDVAELVFGDLLEEMEPYKMADIRQFLYQKHRDSKIYFNPETYPLPVDGSDPFKSDSFLHLRKILVEVAKTNGVELVLNGLHKSKTKANSGTYGRTFLCSHFRRKRSKRHPDVRRRRRVRPCKVGANGETCKFRFNVRFDSVGYYLVGGMGCALHNGHTLGGGPSVAMSTPTEKDKHEEAKEPEEQAPQPVAPARAKNDRPTITDSNDHSTETIGNWIGTENVDADSDSTFGGFSDGEHAKVSRQDTSVFGKLTPYLQEISAVLDASPDPEYLQRLMGVLSGEVMLVKARAMARESLKRRRYA